MRGLNKNDWNSLLQSMVIHKEFQKGEYIYKEGDHPSFLFQVPLPFISFLFSLPSLIPHSSPPSLHISPLDSKWNSKSYEKRSVPLLSFPPLHLWRIRISRLEACHFFSSSFSFFFSFPFFSSYISFFAEFCGGRDTC